MTDRELLELAAKAAGVESFGFNGNGSLCSLCTDPVDYIPWNPLTDDGDALRLAVKLGLVIDVGPISVSVHKSNGEHDLGFEFYRTGKDDPYAATRRAIVRAAAEIGKEME